MITLKLSHGQMDLKVRISHCIIVEKDLQLSEANSLEYLCKQGEHHYELETELREGKRY